MAVATARFIGGPCDGQGTTAPPQPFRDCGGAVYALLQDGNYHMIGTPAGDLIGHINTKQIGRGWHKLMHVFAVEAPAAIRRSQAARARLRRVRR